MRSEMRPRAIWTARSAACVTRSRCASAKLQIDLALRLFEDPVAIRLRVGANPRFLRGDFVLSTRAQRRNLARQLLQLGVERRDLRLGLFGHARGGREIAPDLHAAIAEVFRDGGAQEVHERADQDRKVDDLADEAPRTAAAFPAFMRFGGSFGTSRGLGMRRGRCGVRLSARRGGRSGCRLRPARVQPDRSAPMRRRIPRAARRGRRSRLPRDAATAPDRLRQVSQAPAREVRNASIRTNPLGSASAKHPLDDGGGHGLGVAIQRRAGLGGLVTEACARLGNRCFGVVSCLSQKLRPMVEGRLPRVLQLPEHLRARILRVPVEFVRRRTGFRRRFV